MASTFEIVLTIGLLVVVFGGLAGLALWGRNRRRSGSEGGSTNAEGAEVMLGNFYT